MRKYEIESLIELCKIELQKGTDIETVICYLKALDIMIIDAFKILRKAKQIDLGEAKILVTSNKCWKEESEKIRDFSEELIQNLQKDYDLKIDSKSIELNIDLTD